MMKVTILGAFPFGSRIKLTNQIGGRIMRKYAPKESNHAKVAKT